MALSDTLAELDRTAVRQNRIDALLKRLEGTEDGRVLMQALFNKAVRSSTLTKALQAEYGNDVVREKTVADWRRAHFVEITGA